MDKKEKIDLIFLLIYPVIGALLSHLFKINAFGSVIVFFGVPSLYLTWRAARYARKALLFSLAAGVPLIIIIDYIAQTTQQWVIPHSILPARLFGIVTIEVISWAILNLYFVIMFYEHFLDKHLTKKLWHPRMKYLVAIVLFLFVLFVTFYFYLPGFLNLPYFYLFLGIVLLFLPLLIHLIKRPRMNAKFFKTAAYFFYLTFIYEVTALQLGWWDFPGTQFIGWVSIFTVRFPLEELIFWLFLFAMAILTYYDYFDEER